MKPTLILILFFVLTLRTIGQSLVGCDKVSLSHTQIEVFYPNSTINETLFYKGDSMLVYHTIVLSLYDTSVIKTNYYFVGSSMRYPQDSTEDLIIPIQFKNLDFANGQTVQGHIHIYDSDFAGDSIISCRIPVTLTLQGNMTATQPSRSTESGPDIYFNPASHIVRINLPGGVIDGVEIKDINGRSILKKAGSGTSVDLETRNYPAGIYVAVITTPSGRFVRRIIRD